MKPVEITVINEFGGLSVKREDGTYFYCDPNTQEYRDALDTFQGEVGPYLPITVNDTQGEVVLSMSEFRYRFMENEQQAIKAAAYTDPEVGVAYDNFLVMQFVNLTDPSVIAALDIYIEKGLIDPGRKAEILAPEEL